MLLMVSFFKVIKSSNVMNFKLNMKVSTVGTYQDWDLDVCDVLTGHKE
jgi:hypothetical protein